MKRVWQALWHATGRIGTRLVVEPPFYQGVTIVARLTARPRTDPDNLRDVALQALYRYFDPLVGGPDETGWPFGRPVQAGCGTGDVARPLASLVDEVRLFAADPLTSERGRQTDRIELDPNALIFSFGHQVRATKGR